MLKTLLKKVNLTICITYSFDFGQVVTNFGAKLQPKKSGIDALDFYKSFARITKVRKEKRVNCRS